MPEDAPKTKLANTRALGGDVVTYDRKLGNREAIARQIAEDEGRVIAPSYDHPDIIAGQGTIGLELAHDCLQIGLVPDQAVICCGGGGLSAGTGLAIRHSFPDVRICVVEPVDFDDTARSLVSGRRETNREDARSICDAIQTESPGVMPFEILRSMQAFGVCVSDDEVRAAMRFAFHHLKLVVEPGGAVALAAVLAGSVETRGKTTLAVLSGGNVDPEMFAACQAE
jgi:threonine dehydratase